MSPISASPLSKGPFDTKVLSHYTKKFKCDKELFFLLDNLCSTILNAPILVSNKRNSAGDNKIHIILRVNIL